MEPKLAPFHTVLFQKDLYLIIPAAGSGSRMGEGTNKMFLNIGGVPVLARTLQAFDRFQQERDIAVHAIVVTSEENIDAVKELVREFSFSIVERVVPGGATRQDSVACGVEALATLDRVPSPLDIVFIHDGARCLVDQDTLYKCFCGGAKYDVCVAATPCKSTIKMIGVGSLGEEAPLVERTPSRDLLFEAQTPQVLKYSVLSDVAAQAKESGIQFTDDTALAEAFGYQVRLLPCAYTNIKITTPEDVVIAESLIQKEARD